MTTRSGRAATPCEVSEPAVSPRSGQLKPNGKRSGGRAGAHPAEEERGWLGAVPEFAFAGGLQRAWA